MQFRLVGHPDLESLESADLPSPPLEAHMADSKKPLDQGALDALTLSNDEARAAYQEQRLTLEVGRTIRHWRKGRN